MVNVRSWRSASAAESVRLRSAGVRVGVSSWWWSRCSPGIVELRIVVIVVGMRGMGCCETGPAGVASCVDGAEEELWKQKRMAHVVSGVY